ncbi:MAG TPA: hypothetical protein VIY86_15175, partial [Pirellulaceae bacterium]
FDDETPPYAQIPAEQRSFCDLIYSEIARFAGPDRTSRWVRLHYFSEAYELASYFQSRGVEALLTTDKPSVSYRLPPSETERLRTDGTVEFAGIRFIRSRLRVENLVGAPLDDQQLADVLERSCPSSSPAVIFTHECDLARREVRDMAVRVLTWLERRSAGTEPAASRLNPV